MTNYMKKTKPKYLFINRIFLAIGGILIATKRERHMRIHLLMATFLLTPLLWIKINIVYTWILITLIALLIITELINTAIELTIDLVTRKFSYRAKLAKDIASGSVLIMASLVVMFSTFIYFQPLLSIFRSITIGN